MTVELVWIEASAGTGKTKVLVDRYLRLLLLGASPSRVLCLTFTNAATIEMTNRISAVLSEWSRGIDTLNDVRDVLGREPLRAEFDRAHILFELFISESPNIHTIHAFCQQLLRQFSLEMNISPNFTIIDTIMKQFVVRHLKVQALAHINMQIEEWIGKYSANIEQLILLILDNIQKFEVLTAIKYQDELCKIFNAHSADTIMRAWAKKLMEIRGDMSMSVLPPQLFGVISISTDFNDYVNVFLTAQRTKRRRIITKSYIEAEPLMAERIMALQDLVLETYQSIANAETIAATMLLVKIADFIIQEYGAYKQKYSYLDYNDLIIMAKKLLTTHHLKDWILYRLDGGIDHIMLDEAQDTSVDQWQIIMALLEDILSGEGRDNRSVFVVGDSKQSVYSFQGADLSYFFVVKNDITTKINDINGRAIHHILDECYRSGQVILDAINKIFGSQSAPYFAQLNVRSKRDTEAYVELDLVECRSVNVDYTPFDSCVVESTSYLFAKRVCDIIKRLINNKTILPSTGNCIMPQDIMVLTQTRSTIMRNIHEVLIDSGIPSAGYDKVPLSETGISLDLVAVAKFVLCPHDDLNLAVLLRSPLCGISEEALAEICLRRSGSIWEYILKHHNKIQEIYDLLKEWASYRLGCYEFFMQIALEIDIVDTDLLNEFLLIVKYFVNHYGNNLLEFIEWFERNDFEVKCSGAGVRIMTVHGSKGLQAPVVIVVDIYESVHENILWYGRQLCLYFPTALHKKTEIASKYVKAHDVDAESEYMRLFYVAATRAQDRLYILGKDDSKWYNLAHSILGVQYAGA